MRVLESQEGLKRRMSEDLQGGELQRARISRRVETDARIGTSCCRRGRGLESQEGLKPCNVQLGAVVEHRDAARISRRVETLSLAGSLSRTGLSTPRISRRVETFYGWWQIVAAGLALESQEGLKHNAVAIWPYEHGDGLL